MSRVRTHGTLAKYKTEQCRCDDCREANARYVHRTRQGLSGHRSYDEAEHGNRSKYNHGCRCVLCRTAHSNYQAGYAAGQRRARKEMKMSKTEYYDDTYGGLLP